MNDVDRRTLIAAIAATAALPTVVNAQVAATRVADDLRRAAQTTDGRVEIGPSDGDIIIVEFFDYNCSVCRGAARDMATLLANDRKVRLVLVNVPSLGIPSIEAAKVALAVRDRTSSVVYYEFHKRVYGLRGVVDGARTLEVASGMGLDAQALIDGANAPGVGRALGSNARIANALGLRVTPGYIVGNRFVAGSPGLEGLRTLVAAARRAA